MTFLTSEKAKELQKRAESRLKDNGNLIDVVSQCAIKSTIITLQEYEKMLDKTKEIESN